MKNFAKMTDNKKYHPEMRGNKRVICHISDITETGKGLSIKKIVKVPFINIKNNIETLELYLFINIVN